LAAGSYCSAALTAGGTVIQWGILDGQRTGVPTGLTDVSAMTTGNFFSVALSGIGVLPLSLSQGTVNIAYPDVSFTEIGGGGAITWSRTGTLPPGMSFTDNGDGTATLSGTPTQTGSFDFTAKATDAFGGFGSRSYTLTVFSLAFFDDGGAAAVCVDNPSGFFQWTIQSGPYTGMIYTGTLNVYNGGSMFWSQPGASQYVYIYYDPNNHTAWGYLYDYSSGVYSSLYDADTLNNPAGCGTLQPR
jgi:hypothetical protein